MFSYRKAVLMPEVAKMSGMWTSSYHFLKLAGVMESGLLILEFTHRRPAVGAMVMMGMGNWMRFVCVC